MPPPFRKSKPAPYCKPKGPRDYWPNGKPKTKGKYHDLMVRGKVKQIPWTVEFIRDMDMIFGVSQASEKELKRLAIIGLEHEHCPVQPMRVKP